MKRIFLILPVLVATFALSTLHGSGKPSGAVSVAPTSLDEGDEKIYFNVVIGSISATPAPWNTLSETNKKKIRSIHITNINPFAVAIGSWSAFPSTGPRDLIPGATGSMTLSNASTDYFKAESSGSLCGMIAKEK